MNYGTLVLLLGKTGPNLYMKTFLIFGASGAIGTACAEMLGQYGNTIFASKDPALFLNQIDRIEKFDGVIWAQGQNATDSILDFDAQTLEKVMQANLNYILETANVIVRSKKVAVGTNFVIISSIWSQSSRPSKLSYSVSKAASLAAVRSMAVDLGVNGIQVNAVAPGPIDSPMTRLNLSNEQIAKITSETPIKRLVTLNEVATTVVKFAMGEMQGITGQEIVIDGGWGVSKLV
jgi:3-oxoacyl-[acyl-carrier protein] reductase